MSVAPSIKQNIGTILQHSCTVVHGKSKQIAPKILQPSLAYLCKALNLSFHPPFLKGFDEILNYLNSLSLPVGPALHRSHVCVGRLLQQQQWVHAAPCRQSDDPAV